MKLAVKALAPWKANISSKYRYWSVFRKMNNLVNKLAILCELVFSFMTYWNTFVLYSFSYYSVTFTLYQVYLSMTYEYW